MKKTTGGYDVHGRTPDADACIKRREKLAEKLTDLIGPAIEGEEHEDVVVIVSNHTGVSVIGHANTKWDVVRQAYEAGAPWPAKVPEH